MISATARSHGGLVGHVELDRNAPHFHLGGNGLALGARARGHGDPAAPGREPEGDRAADTASAARDEAHTALEALRDSIPHPAHTQNCSRPSPISR